MKRPFVYVCSRYSEGDNRIEDIRRAGRYCRQLYELGFTLSPRKSCTRSLWTAPSPKKSGTSAKCLCWLLRRCSALVMCDREPDCGMLELIQTAQRLHMLCTTLDSLLAIQIMVQNGKPPIEPTIKES